MLKNSQILPIFGLGLILSTSPLFTLLDSSIVSPETVKLEGEKEEVGEESSLEDSKESLPTTTTEPTVDPQPEESLSEISTTTKDEPQEKEDSDKTEDQVDSSVQQESKESTVDTTSEAKETTESTPSHSQVTKSVTPATTITTTVSSPTSASTEPFAVSPTVPETSTNKGSQTSSGAPKSSESTDFQKQGWRRREYNKDYTSNEKTDTQGLRKVLFTGGKQKYLYSHSEDLKFTLPENQQEYQKIQKDQIKISIFKHSAWSDDSKSFDEYKELSKEEKDELFKDREKEENTRKRLKQILMSLSVRREWTFHTQNNTFKSEIKRPTLIGENNKTAMELKIKYFEKFEELKRYIDYKMDLCSEASRGPCLAKPEELTIIDQDKKSFFTDSKKK